MALWEKPDGTKLETEQDIARYIIEIVRGERFYPASLVPADTKEKEQYFADCAAVEVEHVSQILRRMHDGGKLQQIALTQNVYATLKAATAGIETLAMALMQALPSQGRIVS